MPKQEMPEITRKLLLKVLQMATEEFSNHGCNDFDLIRDGGLTEEEAGMFQTFLLSDGLIDEPCHSQYAMDWIVMLWLRKRVEKMQ